MSLKPLCFLLGLCHAGSAASLGLGEMNLRSSLGQPLHATVALLEAAPDTSAACFSLAASKDGIAPPPRPQLSIQHASSQTLLHIRTSQPINDPFAQFVLVADCETRLQRDYVVLLDPPAPLAPAIEDAPTAIPHAAAVPVAAAAPPARPPQRLDRAPAAAHPTAARTPKPTAPHTHIAPADPVPRLVLSGKRSVAHTAGAPFALRLDTNLPDLARPRPDRLSATELSDENTALSRKLAHLETQLAALQKRNAALEARRPAAPVAAIPPPTQSTRWPVYLLVIGLLAGGSLLIAWLLRRSRLHQPTHLDEAWTQSDPGLMTLSDMASAPEAERQPTPVRMAEIEAPPSEEGTEVKEDILDQAEGFMAHGHGDLAIHLLQEHLREAPTESPVPWLLLLDLLHRIGDMEGYAAASAECRRYFNINLTGHPISQDNEQGQGLEAYPHLLEKLTEVWNTPDINAFFHDLIYDDRGGTRMGFEPGAYRDILWLRSLAREALPLAA